ncbi:MAG: RtcB family protein [Calditerrivibrio sp.]|nr:RtcB family protein [Calditerrivibrio sp.]
MLRVKGDFGHADILTDNVDDTTLSQVKDLCNSVIAKNAKIKIMPDCHAGAGCVIGTTMTISDKIVPNLVGVDIGCGMYLLEISDIKDLERLDEAINKNIPSGKAVRKKAHLRAEEIDIDRLRCAKHVDLNRGYLSIGTLGGGNHFIELSKSDGSYLIIHSGSRHLGKQVAEYYQNLAKKICKKKGIKVPNGLEYLEGEEMEDYLHDMRIMQRYAKINREAMAEVLAHQLGFDIYDSFHTIHNYIDLEKKILRKGAVSAEAGERLLIPMNMKDGSLICVGKGNPHWNFSAPHGAGRIMSRNKAREVISLEDFKKVMKGIYTTTVNKWTLDEAPQAYKSPDEIIRYIGETVDIVKKLTPIYNFKAAE